MTDTPHSIADDAIAAAIAAAVDMDDPLKGLAERTLADPGAPFKPEVLEALAACKLTDRAGFERLRDKLKKAGCRVAALDRVLIRMTGGDPDEPEQSAARSQADRMVEIAAEAELFHTEDGAAYADLTVESLDGTHHRETWSIHARGFRRWLARRFYETAGGAASAEAVATALGVIEARAHFDGPQREVFLRVGKVMNESGETLYLDLCDESWRAVEIDASGWRIVAEPPVRFRRAAGMQKLPVPEKGGSIALLRSFLNVRAQSDFVLAVAWALACIRPDGPYPVIVLSGEQGSAKSTFSAMLRALIDPNTAPLRSLPREDRELFIAAGNGHVLAFDNVSQLASNTSDTLCRLATGGGFSARQLYSDQDEILIALSRPVMLNGIEDFVTRPDLGDRALFLTLEPIAEAARRPERALWSDFEAARPKILGVLLDAVSRGIRELPTTVLPGLPRMADFALWATACESAIWEKGTFMRAYGGNREAAAVNLIEAEPVANAIRTMAERQTGQTAQTAFCGTSTELLSVLNDLVGEAVSKRKDWPANASSLSRRLRRISPVLRSTGIDIIFQRHGGAMTRIVRIARVQSLDIVDETEASHRVTKDIRKMPSVPSVPSASIQDISLFSDLESSSPQTANGQTPDRQTADDDAAAREAREFQVQEWAARVRAREAARAAQRHPSP